MAEREPNDQIVVESTKRPRTGSTGRHPRAHVVEPTGIRITIPKAILVGLAGLIATALAGGGGSLAYHKYGPREEASKSDPAVVAELSRLAQEVRDLKRTVEQGQQDFRDTVKDLRDDIRRR